MIKYNIHVIIVQSIVHR